MADEPITIADVRVLVAPAIVCHFKMQISYFETQTRRKMINLNHHAHTLWDLTVFITTRNT